MFGAGGGIRTLTGFSQTVFETAASTVPPPRRNKEDTTWQHNWGAMPLVPVLICLVAAYLIGSIPFGVLAARSKGVDIFKEGSGNPGATNVGRVLGKTWGTVVFLLDVAKGIAATLVARNLIPEGVATPHSQTVWFGFGLVAVLGHCYSPFLGFRGGKGIATSLGVGLGACPLVAISSFGIFLVVVAVTRYVSLASIIGVSSAILFGFMFPNQAREMIVVYVVLAVFVSYRHRANVQRLLNGTEAKFGKKKDSPSEPNAKSNPTS